MTSPAGDSKADVSYVSDDQPRRIAAALARVDVRESNSVALADFVTVLYEALETPILVAVHRHQRWIPVASAPHASRPFVTALGAAFDAAAASPGSVWFHPESNWTIVACGTHPPTALAVEGDWSRSEAGLAALADRAGWRWEQRVQSNLVRSGLAAHRLARRLSRVRGLREVYGAIVHRMPLAVRARIAALAVPDPADGRLSIVATHGYPRELVEHLRIEPRAGVFGSVFDSGRTLLVTGMSDAAGRRRRPRYRTDSFVAVPLIGGGEVLGVICVTDRMDDQPFTAEDVAVLRAMAAPAALALGREHALVQAEGFALTAAIDPLSGAFNRRHFHMRLEEELQRSRRHSLSLGFLMIDIDDFKAVNDSFGHLAGDTVIRDVAEILRRSVRVFDVCARFGGEEFAIIMPGSVVESAAMVAERIRERIEAYRPADATLTTLSITVSIGLAVSSPGMSAHDLIDTADRALYLAKRAGKNRVCIAGEGDAARPGEERSRHESRDRE